MRALVEPPAVDAVPGRVRIARRCRRGRAPAPPRRAVRRSAAAARILVARARIGREQLGAACARSGRCRGRRRESALARDDAREEFDVGGRRRRSRTSASAARRRAERGAAVLAPDDQLGDHRVVVRRDRVALPHARVDAHGSAPFCRRAQVPQRAGGGQEVPWPGSRRRCAPRSRGRSNRSSFCFSGSGSPAATRSCHSTRSSPVIISVTGCSTCRRVFISMK